MARPKAADHDEKRDLILARASELFAANGYDRSSIATVAMACGMSKALVYHYYTDKSQLLFDIIRGHLDELLAVTDIPAGPDEAPRAHLLALTTALLGAYRAADKKHHVQIAHLHLLPPPQQTALKQMQRALVERFAQAVSRCVPAATACPDLLKPLTMSLFGMVNWNYLWFRDTGRISRADYAAIVVSLLVDGAPALGRIGATPDRNPPPHAGLSAAPGRSAQTRPATPRVRARN